MCLPTQKLSRAVIRDLVPSDYSLAGLQAHSSQLVILEAADICLFRSFEYSTHYFSKPFFEKVTIAIFDHNPCFDLSCWGSSVFDIIFCSYLVSFPPLCCNIAPWFSFPQVPSSFFLSLCPVALFWNPILCCCSLFIFFHVARKLDHDHPFSKCQLSKKG